MSREERDRLVLGCQRWLWYVAGRYSRDRHEQEELVSEGQFGVLAAAESYDPGVGPFAAYCRLPVKRAIFAFLRRQRPTARLERDPIDRRAWLRAQVEAILGQLGEAERVCLQRWYLDGEPGDRRLHDRALKAARRVAV